MSTIYIRSDMNLQDALYAAQPGDVLELPMGAVWSNDLLFPEKPEGPAITVTAPEDQLPPPGNRITEEQSMALPRVTGNNKTSAKASNWILRGMRFEAYPNTYTGGSLDLGGSGINGDIVVSVEADLPRNWTIDRCFFQADPTCGGKRGIAANCVGLTVKDSVIQGYWSDGQDTQAIGGGGGAGPFTIHNWLLGAAGGSGV